VSCDFAQDGVMVAKKDFNAPKHPELPHISNNMVIRAMQVRVPLFSSQLQFPRFPNFRTNKEM
jgi:hypothetical protein